MFEYEDRIEAEKQGYLSPNIDAYNEPEIHTSNETKATGEMNLARDDTLERKVFTGFPELKMMPQTIEIVDLELLLQGGKCSRNLQAIPLSKQKNESKS